MPLPQPLLPDPADDALARSRAQIEANAAVLRAVEDHVERRWAAGDPGGAAGWAQVAGDFAFRNHPGAFASHRIERVLAAAGRAFVPGRPAPPRPAGPPRRVLHVLTEGYDTGGHTRLAWRWMQRDAGREHAVVLTAQRGPVPERLARAATLGVGHVPAGRGLVERAQALREAALAFDAVVLHVHMFDALPCLAFADPAGRPPVVFVDHADHLFWLGTHVADVVTGCRAPASRLAVERRGVAPERTVSLPVPVDPAPGRPDRAGARARLGLGADVPVILTVAAGLKFRTALRPSWFDAAAAALRAQPDAVLLAVGPDPADPEWAAAAAATGGRLAALGMLPEIGDHLAAADVYLDSYPFSSNTSVIEAAGHGIPVVSFAPDAERQGLLLTHDPGIEELIVRAATPDAAGSEVARLLAGAGGLGARLRAGIEAVHSGAGWAAHLDAALERAAALGPTAGAGEAAGAVQDFECLIQAMFAATPGLSGGLERSVAAHAAAAGSTDPQADAAAVLGARPGPRGRRAVAAPPVEPAAVARLVDELRALHAAGAVDACAVALPPEGFDEGCSLLQAALDSGGDLDIDVLPCAGLPAVLDAEARWVAA